jgi:hypothetical protein
MAHPPYERVRKKLFTKALQPSKPDIDRSTQDVNLDLSIPSTALYTLRAFGGPRIRNTLPTEPTQHTRISARQRSRSSVRIGLARVSQVLFTSSWRGVAVEKFTCEASLLRELNILENIALGHDLRARIRFEGVLAVGVKVVVHSVEERVACDLRGAARSMVNVVLLECDEVVGAGEVHAPIMMAITRRRPARGTIDLAVGNGDAVRGRVAEHNVLACDEVGGDVVDPDEVCAVDGDGVAAPDVFRVDVGETHVLDDDVFGVADDAHTLAFDYALGALSD